MSSDTPAKPLPPNAGDVVSGPVGAASLRQPSPSGPVGVDLEALASIAPSPKLRSSAKPRHSAPGSSPGRT
jgi:hypothetical protein